MRPVILKQDRHFQYELRADNEHRALFYGLPSSAMMVYNCSREEFVYENRGASLAFSEDIASGLLDEIAATLQDEYGQNRNALDILTAPLPAVLEQGSEPSPTKAEREAAVIRKASDMLMRFSTPIKDPK